MYDLTKEELEDLLSCCYGGMHDDHPVENYKIALQLKIQSLIDNYCEHEWKENQTNVTVENCVKCAVDRVMK